MKAMFISKELNQTAGSGVEARMHRDVLFNIIGEKNVFVVDVSPGVKKQRTDNYISFGKYKTIYERIIRHIEGNTYLFSNKIIKDICTTIIEEDIEFVFVDDSYFGKLVKYIKLCCPRTTIVTFFHDVKAELFPIWIKKTKKGIQKLDYKLGIWNERISVKHTDANIVLNEYEDSLLKKHYGKYAEFYFPVCVGRPADEVTNPYEKNEKKHILFVGTAYYPNIEGINWFCQNVYPDIREQFDLWIIGKGLEILRGSFKDEGIHVTGYVESLASYYKFADTVVAPLTDGGGMKIKTAEAFSYGKCFVGSSESLHGYYEELPSELINSVVFRCDTVDEYLEAFRRIGTGLEGGDSPQLIELYETNYSPQAAIMIMKKIIKCTQKSS